MNHRRGWTRLELLATLAATILIAAVVWPALAGSRGLARVDASLQNLAVIGAGYALYASDWNGRQVTVIADDIGSRGNTASEAFGSYPFDDPHPPIMLGWGDSTSGAVGEWRYPLRSGFQGNYGLAEPIDFDGVTQFFGAFRMMNTRPLHAYLGGRYYDEIFYAPADTAVIDVVDEAFASPWEWVQELPVSTALGDIPAWSSYCTSPAAQFHPAVMRHPGAGGWQDPWSLDEGFQSPSLFAAAYPDLKTFVLEHHWTINPPEACNPAFAPGTYDGCEPFYFNHGLAAAPATLFYDLSTRLLPNTEVDAANQMIEAETGFGLWSRDTPFGDDGYFIPYGEDASQLSHHILTTDGILGRDTIAAGAAPSAGRRARPAGGFGIRAPRRYEQPKPRYPMATTVGP